MCLTNGICLIMHRRTVLQVGFIFISACSVFSCFFNFGFVCRMHVRDPLCKIHLAARRYQGAVDTCICLQYLFIVALNACAIRLHISTVVYALQFQLVVVSTQCLHTSARAHHYWGSLDILIHACMYVHSSAFTLLDPL